MSTPPPWGWPWHGLVRDGVLTLPNDNTIELTGGTTETHAVIRHPAAPQPQAPTSADIADGRQWWDCAILQFFDSNSAYLYDKSVGLSIYIDDAGDGWRVGLGADGLTLSRFGVLGGKSESYTYPASLPEDDLSPRITDILKPAAGPRYRLWHCNERGSKILYQRYINASDLTFAGSANVRYLSVGWVEIALSGPGSDCSVTVTTLKDCDESLGENIVTSTIDAEEVSSWFYRVVSGDDYSYVCTEDDDYSVAPPAQVTRRGRFIHYVGEGVRTHSLIGHVISMLYDEDGEIVEVTADLELKLTKTHPAVEVLDESPNGAAVTPAITAYQACKETISISITIKRGSLAIAEYSQVNEIDRDVRAGYDGTFLSSMEIEQLASGTCTDSIIGVSTGTDAYSTTSSISYTFPLYLPDTADFIYPFGSTKPAFESLPGHIGGVALLSGQVFGFFAATISATTQVCATYSGPVTPYNIAHASYTHCYGAYCPVTQDHIVLPPLSGSIYYI